MLMCVQWGQTRGNNFSSKMHVRSISWQGGRKRCLCASSGVRRLEENDFIATLGGSSGVRCLEENIFIAIGGESSGVKRLINCFQGCSRWLTKCMNVLRGHVRNPGGHVIKNLSL